MQPHDHSVPDQQHVARRRRLTVIVAGLVLVLSLAVIVVFVLPTLTTADPRLSAQGSLVGTWVRGAALRAGDASGPDPFRLATLRSIGFDSEGRSSAELTVALSWTDGRTQQVVGCTDMVPGFLRLVDPAAGQLTIATAADGTVSIDDGHRSFSLERQ